MGCGKATNHTIVTSEKRFPTYEEVKKAPTSVEEKKPETDARSKLYFRKEFGNRSM